MIHPSKQTTNLIKQGYNGVFVPQMDKFLCGTCFHMVGVHPFMPNTFDGYRILAQAEMRGVHEKSWSWGTRFTFSLSGNSWTKGLNTVCYCEYKFKTADLT